METRLNTFVNRADPDQAGSTLFAYGNGNTCMIRNDPTLMGLTSNSLILCINVTDYLYNYSYWVELSMNIHEGKG